MVRRIEEMTKIVALQGGDANQTQISVTNPLPVASGYTIKTVTIANGASLSGEVDIEGYTVCTLSMPAAWTAADITFAVATVTGGTFLPLKDDSGNEVTSKAAASYAYAQDMNAPKLVGSRFLKLRSGTEASAVAQGGERIITLILKA